MKPENRQNKAEMNLKMNHNLIPENNTRLPFSYEVIRTGRQSAAIQITTDGKVTVRCPYSLSDEKVKKLLNEKKDWVLKNIRKSLERMEESSNESKPDRLSSDELKALVKEAISLIPKRVKHYAPLIGVTFNRITIRNQKSRWGSCSSKGNLNFNVLLMLTPLEVLDSVVVHELCHRKFMNHSSDFYAEVYKAFPEYDKWHGWLKKNGRQIMERNPK